MKNNLLNTPCFFGEGPRHIIRRRWSRHYFFNLMRITVAQILLISITMSVSIAGDGFSQEVLNRKVSLQMNLSSLKEALTELERQAEVKFVYSASVLELTDPISLNVSNEKLSKVLDRLLEPRSIEYVVKNKLHIVLKPAKEKQVGGTVEPSGSDLPGQTVEQVSGTVIDAVSRDPLPGVNVILKGTSVGTVTDIDGRYSLAVPDLSGTLLFSYIGFFTLEEPISGRGQIDVALSEDLQKLDEVVVVGYGTQKKVNLTGSVSTVDAQDLEKRPVANVAQMLQGRMPGVEVIQNTGQPGAEGINIRIRGLNSFGTNNTPIVIVDGIEGTLSSIDPNNIESISVLKDAASAAIYGSRAANGVILVTTKRGKEGVSRFTYHANFALHQAARYPELVNDPVEYMEMFNLASDNSGMGVTYPQSIIDQYRSGELKGYNWDDAFYRKAFVQNHNIGATGGNEKLRYNLGFNYWDQPGILHGFSYEQYRFLLNLDSDINRYISVGAGINFSQGNRSGTADGQSNQMITWAANAPTYGPKLPDGRYTWSAYGFEVHNGNPVALYENGGEWNRDYNVLSNLYIKVKPFAGLTWHTNGGIKYNNAYFKRQVPSVPTFDYYTGEPRGFLGGNDVQLTVNQSLDILYTLFSTVTYEKSMGDHALKGMVGTSLESFRYDFLAGFRRGFPNNDLTELNVGALPAQTTNGTANEWALGSYFGRVNYSFKDRYLLEANARFDGSSRFAPEDRFGFFPSFSAGWILSGEEFASNLGWMDLLKVRASWGELGNQQIGNYPYQDLLSLGYSYAFGSDLEQGVVQTSLTNRYLRWETTTVTDIGLDFESRNGLFTLTFDYFNKTTSDILRPGQVMATTGLTGPIINNGEMRNTGFDLAVGHRRSIGAVKYGVSANFSHYKNELVKFGADEITGRTIKRQGEPYDSWYLNEWDGIFQSQQEIDASPEHYYAVRPGTIKLKDANDDGRADLDDRVIIDGKYPKFMYGVNMNLEWNGFDLSAFFQGVEGVKFYVMDWGLEPFKQGSRPPVKWRNAWSPENPSNELPYLYFAERETSNRQNSSFWLMDGSYLKLKNLQIGYTIPESVLGKLGLQSARIYLTGDNLFVITKFEGFDPERNPDQSRFGEYPQLRIYSAGVKVQF